MDDLNKALNHLFGFKVPIDDYDEFEKKVEEARELKEHLDKVEILKDIPQIITPVKMTKEEWIKIYNAKDGTWDKDDLIDKAYEIIASPIKTNHDRIKSMSVEEMAEFIVKIKLIFGEDIYNHIQEKIKDYVVKIDEKKIPKWKKKERKFYKQWLLQEVNEDE